MRKKGRPSKNYEMYGITMTLPEWSEVYGISKFIVSNRVCSRGWDLHRALTTPIRPRESHVDPLRKLAEQNGIDVRTYKARVYRLGWDKQKAATAPTRVRGDRSKQEVNSTEKTDNTAQEEAMFAVLKFVWDSLDLSKKERLMHMVKVAAEMWATEEAS